VQNFFNNSSVDPSKCLWAPSPLLLGFPQAFSFNNQTSSPPNVRKIAYVIGAITENKPFARTIARQNTYRCREIADDVSEGIVGPAKRKRRK
jgi:hypothetical protein